MGFAENADVPVIIVADIDRGGVFAHLYGTLELLSPSEQDRVIGFVINRFRGDIALLQSGLDWLEEKTGKPVIGVLPYLHGFDLEAEDAIDSQQQLADQAKLVIKVPVFTRISNHTDFDALRQNPDIDLQYIGKGGSLAGADVIILPGSKSTRADLEYLRSQGWDKEIAKHLRFGGKVVGICGGFQMLGSVIADPLGIEGEPGQSQGLGYLDITTTMGESKTLTRVKGDLQLLGKQASVSGYEIHAGVSTIDNSHPIQLTDGRLDGAVSDCGQIFGTYLHGVFDDAQALALLCEWMGFANVTTVDHQANQERAINRIADAIEEHLNLELLWPELGKDIDVQS
ncbi:cobyric acid synthase [Vibrio ponticus]|nr:cobyric acid synthase [Vibrio ponticus]